MIRDSAESSKSTVWSADWVRTLALLGTCCGVYVLALARPPLHLGLPGHSALFWLPPLLIAARWGPRGSGTLVAGMGTMLCWGMGVVTPAKVGGYLLAGATIEAAYYLGRQAPEAVRMVAAGIGGHLGKLAFKILLLAGTGLPMTRAEPHLLWALVLYASFGAAAALLCLGGKSLLHLLRPGAPPGSPRSGMTLVELLVVISITAILSSLLMPVFTQARSKAQQTKCLSNIRQISMAMLMYAQDWEYQLCPTRSPQLSPGSNQQRWIWPHFLQPYVRDAQVFLCPLASYQTYAETWEHRGELSYGLNRHLEDPETDQARSLKEFEQPSCTILLADSTCGPTDGQGGFRGFQVREDRAPDTRSGISSRHQGLTNIAFLDGHARCYPAETVVPALNQAGVWWFPSPAYGPVP